MSHCIVHPDIEAAQPCADCLRPFCDHCLAEILGRKLCEECKFRAVQGVVARGQRHPLALLAVLVPVVGYLTCILAPVTSLAGLYLGWKVVREVREQPGLSGRSAGLAAMVISGGSLASWILAALAILVTRFR